MGLRLVTERLEIRPFVARDLDGLHAMYGDPEVMTYIGDGRALSREETARLLLEIIAQHDDDRPGLLASDDRASGVLVGRCGYKTWTVDGNEELEIGWMVVRAHQGRGLATEQAIALRDHAFARLGVDHVIAVIQPENEASIRVAEKTGGRFWREWVTPGGQDVVLFRCDAAGNRGARPSPA